MKLFTRPRVMQTWQLVTGDLIACELVDGSPVPIADPGEFLDLDLREAVVWCVVHNVDTAYLVNHDRGQVDADRADMWIVREGIELDPWSYVQSR